MLCSELGRGTTDSSTQGKRQRQGIASMVGVEMFFTSSACQIKIQKSLRKIFWGLH